MGDVLNMRRRPAVASLTYVCRHSLLAGHLDHVGDQALLDRVVDLGKAHHRHVHSAPRHGSACDFRAFTRIWVVGIEMILGCGLTWSGTAHCGSGSDEERAVRSDERGAESLDCTLVLFTDLGELGEVLAEGAVVEGEVYHAIGLGSAAAQALHIFKVPSMHLGPGGDQRLSASLATSEAEYLIASVD